MTAHTPAVTCREVTHEYSRERSGSGLLGLGGSSDDPPTVTALEDVSLTVEPGAAVGIAGPSGSGKSTLLHLLAGLETPTSGEIRLVGSDLASQSERDRARLRRRHVGIVFQRFHLLPSLSARANVELPLVQLGKKRSVRRSRALELLERVGLEDRTDHVPGSLSGGEQQRVAIARAVAAEPDVVLADEPTGELDTETGDRILELLTGLPSNPALLLASHDEAALAKTDRTIHLRDGRRRTNDAE